MTLHQLVENWEDYHVYYAGVSLSSPTAILFDPKSDDKNIELHKYWAPIKNKEDLLDVTAYIHYSDYGEPVLKKVLGPDGSLYAYMYTIWVHVLIKAIDDKTLWIDYLQEEPMPSFIEVP